MSESQRKLRLRSGFMVVPGQAALHIRSLRRTLRLRGQHASTLLPQVLEALDGLHTVDEVAAALGPGDTVREVVSLLERAGLLEDSQVVDALDIPADFRSLLDGMGVEVGATVSKLKAAQVAVLAEPEFGSYITAALMSFGLETGQIRVADTPASWVDQVDQVIQESTIVLAALPHWQPDVFLKINQACVEAGKPWLPLQAENEVSLLIGPFVVPGESACYACFERRRRANLMELAEMQLALDSLVTAQPSAGNYRTRSVRPLLEPAFAMAATEVLKYAAGLEFYLATLNKVVSFTPFVLEMESMPVLKVPRCPACSHCASTPSGRVWMGE